METFTELKTRYDALKEAAAKSQTKLEMYNEHLADLGCGSIEDAKSKIVESEAERVKLEEKINSLISKIKNALEEHND